MKNIFYLLIATLFIGCSSLSTKNKQLYIDEFKFRYFQLSLKKGFNNSTEIKKLLEIDKSGFSEPLLSDESYKIIDSLSNIASYNVRQDSINSIGKKADGSEGKLVLTKCLEDFNSKWLNSISKIQFKKN